MSALNQDQLQSVAQWFAAGASLDEIQKRIKSEFDVHMTYLDLRLLVADLPQPVEPDPPAAEPESPVAEPVPDDFAEDQPYDSYDAAPGTTSPDAVPSTKHQAPGTPSPDDAPSTKHQAPSTPGDVTVELDALTIPGTYASGDVTFSDGTKAKWYLDQQGRLGLGNVPDGYRPSPTDAALFQSRLMELLRSHGMM